MARSYLRETDSALKRFRKDVDLIIATDSGYIYTLKPDEFSTSWIFYHSGVSVKSNQFNRNKI